MSSESNTDSEAEENVSVTGVRVIERSLLFTGFNRSAYLYIQRAEFERNAQKTVWLSDQVFSNPLILKHILKYLEEPDLLRTSFVNKRWNYFSREVLRENKSCMLSFLKCACEDIRCLLSTLCKSTTVPYNGISMNLISTDQNPQYQCVLDSDLNELMELLLGKVCIKYLDLVFEEDDIVAPCISSFVRKIVSKNTLEELSVHNLPLPGSTQPLSEIIGLDPVGQWLPNVRIMKFSVFKLNNFYNIPLNMFKELLEASPKLEKLYGKIDTGCLEFIVPLNLSHVVKEFFFSAKRDTMRNCLAFSTGNPKLEKLRFVTFDEEDIGDPKFPDWQVSDQNVIATALKQLLESSKDSLKKVALDHSDLMLMTHKWNIPVLEEVTLMDLHYCPDFDSKEGCSTLRIIEWTKYFPNLKDVVLTFDYYDGENEFYIGDALRVSGAQFVCESVTSITWMGSWEDEFPDEDKLEMFGSVFPNVKEFCLRESNVFVPYLMELWTAWPGLEAIYIPVALGRSSSNYDSVFSGVSKEEAAYLLENVEDFESLEIVPTAPSICNLRKLKRIFLGLMHDDEGCYGTTINDETFFLSRLTGHCAFSRAPGLVVEIGTGLCQQNTDNWAMHLKHLEPFVNFVERELGEFEKSF